MIIQDRSKSLEQYVKREKPSQYYIDKENELIGVLVNVYNVFEKIEHFELLIKLSNKMKELELIDSEIGGFNILLQTKETNKNYSLIILNHLSHA